MLLKQDALEAIVAGRIDLVYRRWARARVKVGSRVRTHLGVLEVLAVDVVTMRAITDREARRAGFASREPLLSDLKTRSGRVHRIRLRFAGSDSRVSLRGRESFRSDELETLTRTLARSDAASDRPWTRQVLRLIRERPGVRAADLAASMRVETRTFKTRVRRLKELGLTESLAVGYRLSPRGIAFLGHVDEL